MGYGTRTPTSNDPGTTLKCWACGYELGSKAHEWLCKREGGDDA